MNAQLPIVFYFLLNAEAIKETDVHFSKELLKDFIETIMARYYMN